MKRRLILMRHAKSDWHSSAQSDHARPLNGRGQRDAPHLGEVIAARGYVPARVISSDAARTRETWDGIMQSMPESLTPRFTRSLYLSGLAAIRQLISAVPADVESLMLLGHNPGFSLAASWLSGDEVELKTAFAAVLEAEGATWTEAMGIGKWTLVDLLTPQTRV